MANMAAVLAVISAVLATAAFVLIMIVWSRPDAVIHGSKSKAENEANTKAEPGDADPASEGSSQRHMMYSEDQRIYLIAVNAWKRPYKYINSEGKLEGGMLDIGKAVCKAAGKQCRFPYPGIDSFPCFDAQENTAIGLEENWFDACIGYYKTPERSNVAKFSKELMSRSQAWIFIKKGSGKTVDGLSTGQIGFPRTGSTNPQCAERFGYTLQKDKIVFTPDADILFESILNGTIDYGIVTYEGIPDGLEVIGTPLECAQSGLSLMVSKTSDMLGWFNAGFRQILEDGTYHEICSNSKERYGAPMPCL